ncbi:MAG: DUF5074 domain-containing protein [Bdellovibrionota bacterium]
MVRIFLSVLLLSTWSWSYGAEFRKLVDLDRRALIFNVLYHDGRIFFPDSTNKSIRVIDGKTLNQITSVFVGSTPGEMAAYGNHLFVSTFMKNYLTVIDTKSLDLLKAIDLTPEMLGPSALAVSGKTVYVSDMGTRLIRTLSAENLRLGMIYNSGSGPYKMAASQGRIFIISVHNMVDPLMNTIRVLDGASGAQLMEFEKPGNYNSIFRHTDGRVYTVAPSLKAMLSFEPGTLAVSSIPLLDVYWPQGLASFGSKLLLLDRGSRDDGDKPALLVIDPWLTRDHVVKVIDLKELSGGLIKEPRAMAVTPDGNVVIQSVGMVSVVSGI